jgi:DNA helicase-2/ATP-dependent DNA helicase PcrA
MTWALAEAGIAVASDAWVRNALRDASLRKVRALALLALNITDSLAWMTLLHLADGIGGSTLDRLYRSARPGETFAIVVQRARIEEIAGLNAGQTRRVRDVVNAVFSNVPNWAVPEIPPPEGGWATWLQQHAPKPLGHDAIRLLELVSRRGDPSSTLGSYLAQMEPLGKDFALSEQDAVRFMTIGASKGLTMDTVIVVGVEEGNIPMPLPRGNPDEERRLLYVAMTRATDYCILTMCRFRQGPIARTGAENLNARSRSPLLEGVLAPIEGDRWLDENGF